MHIISLSRNFKRLTSGFTIIELLIATSVFGLILLVIATGAIRFTDDYYKGITSAKTQSTARSIMLEFAKSIEFGTTVVILPAAGDVGGLCVDNVLYSYHLGQQVTDVTPDSTKHQDYHGLVSNSNVSCTSGVTPSVPSTPNLPANSRELLNQHMRLSAFEVTQNGNIFTIHVRVIYGDDDLLNPPISGTPNWANEGCTTITGSKFCATSDLSTTVEQRLL